MGEWEGISFRLNFYGQPNLQYMYLQLGKIYSESHSNATGPFCCSLKFMKLKSLLDVSQVTPKSYSLMIAELKVSSTSTWGNYMYWSMSSETRPCTRHVYNDNKLTKSEETTDIITRSYLLLQTWKKVLFEGSLQKCIKFKTLTFPCGM